MKCSKCLTNTDNCESLNNVVYEKTCTEFEYGRFSTGNNDLIVFRPNDKVENVTKITLGKFQTNFR